MKLKRRRVAAAIPLLAVLFVLAACSKDSDAKDEKGDDSSGTVSQEQQEQEEETGIVFPYELEGGKLIVNSLFQSSIENPDCNNEIGEDIASLEITNQSDEFCTSVQITVTMPDGAEIPFAATNIPGGKTVWIFAADNQSIDQEVVSCEKIEGSAEFGESSMMEDQISVVTDDTTITIQNLTENTITNLDVHCHCLFEEVYFGGLTYNYPVESIAAGESVTIEAEDCYMGTAEVVGVTQGS